MSEEKQRTEATRSTLDRTGERTVSEEGLSQMRPTVASAVRNMRSRMPSIRPNGIFRHPSDWTQEELDFIADCLKQNIPIYTIANMVHCEKHTLSTMIANNPELTRLKEDKYENLLDEAEYQADRLMKQGNASLVIHVLNTLGRKRGWTMEETGGGGKDDGSRIVMGLIPDEEVQKADDAAKAIKGSEGGKTGTEMLTDPVALAAVEDMVKGEVEKRVSEMTADAIEVEGTASPPAYAEKPQGGESVVELAERQDMDSYMSTGAGGYGQTGGDMDDPWASGADSMFFQ